MIRRNALANYLDRLQQEGRIVFTAGEAERALRIGHRSFLDSAERLQRVGKLLCPRQGFYVVVPAQYHTMGTPPLTWYIDALMQSENQPYYVGLLKAAEILGATHHAVMQFQVICGKRLPELRLGRTLVAFYFRRTLPVETFGIEDRKSDTGSYKISTGAMTALDLFRYPHASGGLDNVTTVLADLAENINLAELLQLSNYVEQTTVQRLGYLLDWLGESRLSEPLHSSLLEHRSLRWTELVPSSINKTSSVCSVHRNAKWRIKSHRHPDPDL